MGYFDALANSCFGRVGNNWVFFPWGTLGHGYTIPNEEEYRAIRSFVRRYLLVSLPLVVLVGLFVGWLFSFLLLPAFGLFYVLKVRVLTRHLGKSSERLTLRQSYRTQAASHSGWMLWLLEVASALFVIIGVVILIANPQDWLIGLASIVFFGLCAVAIGYMIRAKRASSGGSPPRKPTGPV